MIIYRCFGANYNNDPILNLRLEKYVNLLDDNHVLIIGLGHNHGTGKFINKVILHKFFTIFPFFGIVSKYFLKIICKLIIKLINITVNGANSSNALIFFTLRSG